MGEKGVSTRVASDYYRMMEKTRLTLRNKYGIKVKSHTHLTKMMCLAPPIYNNKRWIQKVRKWNGR